MIPYGTKGTWDGADLVIRVPNAANEGSISGGRFKLWPCSRCGQIEWVETNVASFLCPVCEDMEGPQEEPHCCMFCGRTKNLRGIGGGEGHMDFVCSEGPCDSE